MPRRRWVGATVTELIAHASTRTPPGTVSGATRGEWGSLLELTGGGAEPLVLGDGSARTFLEDGDVVTLSATAPATDGGRISLGEVTGRVEPAR